MDRLSDYDYSLPAELIAAEPPARRSDARMLVIDRASQSWTHSRIDELPRWLAAGDCLILNDTRVIPARLVGRRAATGGKWEGLFLGVDETGRWRLLMQTRGRLLSGEAVLVDSQNEVGREPLRLVLEGRGDDGVTLFRPEQTPGPSAAGIDVPPLELLDIYGAVPLPPYIRRGIATADDRDRYQTTYARHPGAVAAPTAGLHFTPELLDACRLAGVRTGFVTLHVGVGTFRPVSVENLADHQMHAEWCSISDETARLVRQTRKHGGRVVAVGTTSVRTLESASATGETIAWTGDTRLFIRPPWTFRAVDALLTNFHLPKSTLLMLVSALAGTDLIRQAYQAAIAERFRFFSYGDAMLIV